MHSPATAMQHCLFAHFDKDNRIADHVLRYLGEIKQLGFSIVFISSARLDGVELERVGGCCDDIMLRENAGLDFGSWAAGLAKYRHAVGGRVLLANDSVYGPIGSLAAAFDRLTRTPADFYGMVESLEPSPHLQSWFLLFEPWVVASDAFAAILKQPFSRMNKRQIIRNGEIALSRRLVGAGFRYEALFRNARSKLMNPRYAANPMLVFWRELLVTERVPFLKIELLRDNPIRVEDAATILRVVDSIDPSLRNLISSHLARTGGKQAQLQRPFWSRWRHALIRRRYRLQQEDRPISRALNVAQLELLTALLHAWRFVKDRFQEKGRAA
jgi:lipopolysaccharide biosynthesis protein